MRRTVLLLTVVGAVLLACTGVVLAQQADQTTPDHAEHAKLNNDPLEQGQGTAAEKKAQPTAKQVTRTDLTSSELQAAEEPRLGDSSFSVMCAFSHRNNDDPIVYPGKQGAAHSHDFFGNYTTRFDSTYTSLRNATIPKDTDGTNCTRAEDKSAYWIPTVKWNNTVLDADIGIVYYRSGNKDHKTVQPFPKGLKVVTAPNNNVSWRCEGGAYSKTPPTQCSNGQLNVRITFPDCSNGKVDSADHRSHLTHSKLGSDGTTRVCPSTHPTPIPQLSLTLRYDIPTTSGTVSLSSGTASTMHSDFFDAWDRKTLESLVADCIRGVGPSDTRPDKCSGL